MKASQCQVIIKDYKVAFVQKHHMLFRHREILAVGKFCEGLNNTFILEIQAINKRAKEGMTFA